MKKYLITTIVLLTILTAYLGYQLSIKNPVLEFTVSEDTILLFDNKHYQLIQETTTICNVPTGHYELDSIEFEVDKPNTTIIVNYKF